jgi:hypothetical protein
VSLLGLDGQLEEDDKREAMNFMMAGGSEIMACEVDMSSMVPPRQLQEATSPVTS